MQRRNFLKSARGTTTVASSLATRLNTAEAAKQFGLKSIELLPPNDLPTVQKHGMTCAMISAPSGIAPADIKVGGIKRAFNRTENHDPLVPSTPWLRLDTSGPHRRIPPGL